MMISKQPDERKQESPIGAHTDRIVIVLGRSGEVDLKPLVDRAWKERVPLVIINLGFPLTPPQMLVVDAALAAAGTGAISLDSMIAYDARQAALFLHENDEVIFATSRSERRKVARAPREGRSRFQ